MSYVVISLFVLIALAMLIIAWRKSGEIARDYHWGGRSLTSAALRSVLTFSAASYVTLIAYFVVSYFALAGTPSITMDGIKSLFQGSWGLMPKILTVLIPLILIRVTWVGLSLNATPRS